MKTPPSSPTPQRLPQSGDTSQVQRPASPPPSPAQQDSTFQPVATGSNPPSHKRPQLDGPGPSEPEGKRSRIEVKQLPRLHPEVVSWEVSHPIKDDVGNLVDWLERAARLQEDPACSDKVRNRLGDCVRMAETLLAPVEVYLEAPEEFGQTADVLTARQQTPLPGAEEPQPGRLGAVMHYRIIGENGDQGGGQPHLHVESLCADPERLVGSQPGGAATTLLQQVARIAKAKGLPITLSALPTAVPFYLQYGFQLRDADQQRWQTDGEQPRDPVTQQLRSNFYMTLPDPDTCLRRIADRQQ